MTIFNIPTFNILIILFAITSSITTFDIRLIQAKRDGALLPDEPLLPSWVAGVYWIHYGLIITMLIMDWKHAVSVLIIGFILKVLPVWETIGNILMLPFKNKKY